jgi:hypothetical protein
MGRPAHLQAFVDQALPLLAGDPRVVGVGAGGSWIAGDMDEFSDLDLVIAVAPEHETAVSRDRQAIAASLGPLLAAFTGEHVGEPRLLICLYGTSPLAHVDLKFVAVSDLVHRVEDPVVLWERSGAMTRAMAGSAAHYPGPRLQWIEDRFWVWVHYVAGKIGRGEHFEALDALGFLRARVLGPLLMAGLGHRPNGARRIEQHAGAQLGELDATVAVHDGISLSSALAATATLYQRLRDEAARTLPEPLIRRDAAERAALAYAAEVGAAVSARGPAAPVRVGD